ncbi:hypothetical protein HW555_008594 [Spodoptera exigua]|uniref:DUF7041 domain-containing protein n=1 Tax=Spodoptera exigua TaxID=7107 RepID=A0A835GE13_SPOEX|nr:hypothetical protein HW555_008594 [Spodoptera exigua]
MDDASPMKPQATLSKEDVEMISVKSRIPPFWRDKPRLWFAQFETMVSNQKLSEEGKFGLAVAQLDKVDVEQISDIILSSARTGRFEALKTRLLSVYEESENKQLQKLLNEVELGDQRPSQLLRRMRDLARDKMPDETLRMLWMSHLPSSTRAVLAVSEESKLDSLAAMADKMGEQTKEANSVCSCSHTSAATQSSTPSPDDRIINMIEALTKEVAALKMDRSRNYYRGPRRDRYRSRSRSKSTSRDSSICYFHRKFGKEAYRCRLSVLGHVTSASVSSINTVDDRQPFHDLLAKYPDITRPTLKLSHRTSGRRQSEQRTEPSAAARPRCMRHLCRLATALAHRFEKRQHTCAVAHGTLAIGSVRTCIYVPRRASPS